MLKRTQNCTKRQNTLPQDIHKNISFVQNILSKNDLVYFEKLCFMCHKNIPRWTSQNSDFALQTYVIVYTKCFILLVLLKSKSMSSQNTPVWPKYAPRITEKSFYDLHKKVQNYATIDRNSWIYWHGKHSVP